MGQTLEQLENDFWDDYPDSSELMTTLVTNCHRLRKKPIDQFTIEDLRIMIGQDIGTKYLMPKALDVLESNPFASGDFYEGDLLHSLMKMKLKEYWKVHPEHANRARAVVLNTLEILNSREEEDLYPSDKDLIEEANQFLTDTSP
jgi:CDI immunity proteins